MPRFPRCKTAVFLLLALLQNKVHGWANRLKCNVEMATDKKIMKRYVIPSSRAELPVLVQVKRDGDDDDDWSSSLSTTSENSNKEDEVVQVRLRFASALLSQNVEWVVEVDPPEAAEFVGGMCRGKRAMSKQQEPVRLRIKDPSIPFTLVGGYAAGFEAVTLTETLQIGENIGRGREIVNEL